MWAIRWDDAGARRVSVERGVSRCAGQNRPTNGTQNRHATVLRRTVCVDVLVSSREFGA